MLFFRKALFVLLAIFCITPWCSPSIALLLGILVALGLGEPFLNRNKRITPILLQSCIVGLGFGIQAQQALMAGKTGFLFTIAIIFGAIAAGTLLGKWLKVDSKISHLISCGTAICGGSAIAAIAPIIEAEKEQISVALGTIFILNAIALFIFPVIGHAVNLNPHQFGLWAAIAIHDTSSVVGAASHFGNDAIQYATTVKLSRSLWIIPVAFFTAFKKTGHASAITPPYFIGFFIVALLLNSFVPGIAPLSGYIVLIAKKGLTLALFLIGCGLSLSVIKMVGFRPMLQGILLWVLISVISLLAVMQSFI